MNILLIDADSKIPNLALCKLSTFHKSINDNVTFLKLNIPYYPHFRKNHYYINYNFDKIYCSVIFDNTINYIHGNNIIFGGTGYDLTTELNPEIEKLQPDYSLYPDNDTSYGFITRGCIRNCSFCKVPKKEGYIRQVNIIDNIVKHKKVKFLDNNILALPNHYDILQELVDKQIKCQFNQGLDIRLLDEKNSKLLSEMNYLHEYIFALDNVNYITLVDNKIKQLLTWIKDWQLKFFVYIHPNMQLQDTIKRIEYLKSIKQIPYLMRDISCWDNEYSEFYIDLCAWTNQVHLFKKMTFIDFITKRGIKKERMIKDIELYRS